MAKILQYPVEMGKVEGGMKCVKYLLFVFNFIFWVSGYLALFGKETPDDEDDGGDW